nr:reverse transcriptase domain-containing protein [Tanacetum cinerariifolium]
FSELHQLDTFYNALKLNDQDALNSAAGGNFLDKIPSECLSIIESKSKVRYSRSRTTDSRANTNAPLTSSLPSNCFDLQQIAASLEDKLDIRMNRFEKSLIDMKNSFVTPTAPIKAVEENQTKLPIEEPKHSFKMGYEHFNTNLVTKGVAKSSTKNLIPIPHECEVTSENGNLSFLSTFLRKKESGGNMQITSTEWRCYSQSTHILILQQIDVVAVMDDVLPPSVDNNDSDEEVDDVDVLRVDNSIQNSEHEYSESEDSDFDNPPVPLPPPEPPDEEFDFEIDGDEIFVVRSAIVKFEYIDARVKFDVFNVKNDVLSYFMFDKVFSLLSAESEDTIFDPIISD